ncbi:MAG: acyltransferase family protein [Bacteroidetes bacterium]|jgi:peptidoglycan/LPS O-acetylase OafA/YrhL|nr:acyltransferase family protein [Bacteroidota bacterium]MDF2452208.1 acyltransferase family protein [Bacteroidota bacterium]
MIIIPKTETQRIEPLDSLRGIAALLVVVFHVKYIFKLPLDPISEFVVSKFGLGVPLFFVLSSFSIFYSLDGKEFSIKSVQYYFVRRFFRIAPLYYFLLLVYFFYRHESLFSLEYLTKLYLNMTFSFGFSPANHEGLVPAGWSIGIEFLIYFVLPIFFCLIRNYKVAFISFLIVFVATIILTFEYNSLSYVGESYSYKNIAVMLPFFFLGIFIFYIYKTKSIMVMIGRKKIILFFLTLIGAFLVYATYYYQIHHKNIYVNFINYAKMYVYVSIVCFLFLILLQLSNPVSLFHNKFFNYAGKWSYSIYLVHPLVIFSSKPVYDFIYSAGLNSTLSFCFSLFYTLSVVIILSYFAFIFIETKGINAGKLLIDRLKRPAIKTS